MSYFGLKTAAGILAAQSRVIRRANGKRIPRARLTKPSAKEAS